MCLKVKCLKYLRGIRVDFPSFEFTGTVVVVFTNDIVSLESKA